MPSISTKRGDSGNTDFLGERVKKSDLKIEFLGCLDELCSFLGMVEGDISRELQDRLMRVMSDVSCGTSLFTKNHLIEIESKLKEIEDSLEPLHSFILPRGGTESSWWHICRSICRRCERAAVRCGAKKLHISYLNRLSDFMFLMARKTSKNEEKWKPS